MPYVRARLSGREYLSADQMWQQHFAEYPVEAVRAVLSLLEGEGVPGGLLRPSDDVETVLQPPATWNPFMWMRRRAAFEDVVAVIDAELAALVPEGERAGTFCTTLEDLVRAWSRFGPSRLRP
jgi:hypothetical protein